MSPLVAPSRIKKTAELNSAPFRSAGALGEGGAEVADGTAEHERAGREVEADDAGEQAGDQQESRGGREPGEVGAHGDDGGEGADRDAAHDQRPVLGADHPRQHRIGDAHRGESGEFAAPLAQVTGEDDRQPEAAEHDAQRSEDVEDREVGVLDAVETGEHVARRLHLAAEIAGGGLQTRQEDRQRVGSRGVGEEDAVTRMRRKAGEERGLVDQQIALEDGIRDRADDPYAEGPPGLIGVLQLVADLPLQRPEERVLIHERRHRPVVLPREQVPAPDTDSAGCLRTERAELGETARRHAEQLGLRGGVEIEAVDVVPGAGAQRQHGARQQQLGVAGRAGARRVGGGSKSWSEERMIRMHRLYDIIDKKQSIAINDLQSNPFPRAIESRAHLAS